MRKLKLRHVSGNYIRFEKIMATVAERYVPIPSYPVPPPTIQFPYSNEASSYAQEAIRLVDSLEGYATYTEYGTYLLPIKKSAAEAYAASSARGSVGERVHNLLVALKAQIEFASPYLDSTFERDYAFQIAV